jgi:hypothetical protein
MRGILSARSDVPSAEKFSSIRRAKLKNSMRAVPKRLPEKARSGHWQLGRPHRDAPVCCSIKRDHFPGPQYG